MENARVALRTCQNGIKVCKKRLILALLALSPLALQAQDAPPPAVNSAAARADLPLILLFTPSLDPKQKDEPNLLVSNALLQTIIDSGQYQVYTYRPDNALVRRALAEKRLTPGELAAAELTLETRHKLARIYSAAYILKVSAAKVPEGIKTSTQFEQTQGVAEWTNVFLNEGTINAAVGRKRFSPKETAAIAADSITTQMGLPSHLPDSLKLESKMILPKGVKLPKEDKTAQKQRTGNKEQGNAEPAPPRDPMLEQPTDPNTGRADTEKADKTTKQPAQNGKTAQPNSTLKPSKTDAVIILKPTNPRTNNPKNPKPNDPANLRPNEAFSAFTTDNATGRTEEPTISRSEPPQDNARLDYEAMAIRFRQSGDTANMITALRRAINDKPHDTNLRKLLVQAYQDRRLPDAARLEAERALILAPDDSILHRLHGETLLADGNTAGASKAFAEAIRLNPTDISSQVALGDALLADNQYASAISAYEGAAKNDPRSSLPHRRLARVHAAKASSDTKEYTAALKEVDAARSLIAPADAETYQEDFLLLLRIMDSRLNDLLAQLQGSYTARLQGKQSGAELVRITVDMKERSEAAADFLDKLPGATGLEMVQARYAQGAAYLLQATTFFRDYLTKGDSRAEESYKGAQPEAQREFANALKRLNGVKKK